MKNSYYRNWHKPATWYKAKWQQLSDLWWPNVSHGSNYTEITFSDAEGRQITFKLNAEEKDHLIKNLIK